MAVQKFVIPAAGGRGALTIYAEPTNLNYFLKTPLTPEDSSTQVVKQSTVKAHTRRQYPDDPTPINVSGSNREYLVSSTARSGRGLPGRTITLVGDPGQINEERRSFTLKGRWIDFDAWIRTNAKMEMRIYNNTGKNDLVKAAATAP